MRTATLLLACFLTVGNVWGQTPDVDKLVGEGKDALYRQEYALAEELFGQIVDAYPESPVGYGMLSITTWGQLLHAASNVTLHEYGTPNPYSDSEIYKPIQSESERFREATDQLLSVCDAILREEPRNVLALYFRGLAYENLAAEAVVITRSSRSAVSHGRRAKSIHEEVLKLDPDFVDANVSVAAYEYALATLPWGLKLLLGPARLFGFLSGDKEKAFELLETVGRRGKYRDLDARIILSLMHSAKGDPSRAVSILEDIRKLYPENWIIDIHLAGIQELTLEDPAAALAIYKSLEESLSEKTPGLEDGELQFLIGKTYYAVGEYDLATDAFGKALSGPTGELETEPLSHFFLALIREEQGSEEDAAEYYRQFLARANSMESLQDEIRIANRRIR